MYKLTVVGGPTRGTAYQVREGGETSIGRIVGNDIVLESQKISKKHCVLVVDNTGVTVKDTGSSNGTFVNGVLTKAKALRPGDRLSVGEYVLELTKVVEQALRPQPMGQVIALPTAGMPPVSNTNSGFQLPPIAGVAVGGGVGVGSPVPSAPVEPKDPAGKVKFLFEKYIGNFLYNLNEKQEWRQLLASMMVLLIFAVVYVSVSPVMDRANEKLGDEAKGRSLLLARQIAERNSNLLYEHMETKTDVGFVERDPGVKSAYLIDTGARVIAPARMVGQSLSVAVEASFAATALRRFQENEDLSKFAFGNDEIVGAAVPVKVFNPASGKNAMAAIALVFYDRSMVVIDSGTESLIYIQSLVLAALFGVIAYFSMYRLTLRPLAALNEEADRVLKAGGGVVNKKYKMEEIDSLVDVVNAALQRAAQAASNGTDSGGPDEIIPLLKFLSSRMRSEGVMLFTGDKKIAFINSMMEEISGIRSDSAIGSDIQAVARDAAFSAFVEDLFTRAPVFSMGGEASPLSEDFEFSGVMYKIESVALGNMGIPKAWLLTVTKANG